MKTVRDILKSKGGEVVTIGPDSTALAALTLMAEKNIGAIMVVDSKGDTVGIFSERDFARKIIVKGRECESTPVKDIMTKNITYAEPDTTIEACMNLMTDGRFRHLPVKDKGKLAGVISIGDVVKALIKEQGKIIAEQAFEIGQNERKSGGVI
ncbi:MAG TPA: CBS domain-containing protein [Spirochaetia bacterium]|nr:CBS domain-containing protein [Spirochaetales bacterium]HRY81025.1 CBS domain-containing protein [Spirochaetia bacterium]HRZ90476.1 CBS domain-containing protein [Spirochaetia bacterium]